MSSSRRATALLGALLLLACAAGIAIAAMPNPNASIEAHRHGTGGHDWHVQIEVGRTGRVIKTLVVYAQECDVTAYALNVAIAPDGSFAVDRSLPKSTGTWFVKGTFTDSLHAAGTWGVKNATCDTGERPFEGHGGDDHAHVHVVVGNPREFPRAAIRGPSRAAGRLRWIHRISLANVPRFSTPARARASGYLMTHGAINRSGRTIPGACPRFWHMRINAAHMWGKLLDPRHPQSLVFWCNSAGEFTLAAFMFRDDPKATPPTFGNLIQWHKHAPTATWMTHLWLVPDIRQAWATCAPFSAFEALGKFSYETFATSLHLDMPCSTTDRHGLP